MPRTLPVSGGWLAGQDLGDRRQTPIGALRLEVGGRLPHATMAYETFGELNEDRSNAVLVLHALTGDTHVTSTHPGDDPAGPGWWSEIVGPGLAIDTDRYFVLVPNVLGGCQGSTGPSSTSPNGMPWGARFPILTVRDQVAAELRLADALGISSFALVVGGSVGGQRAIEWAVTAPDRVERVAVVASNARTSADQIAWAHSQIGAIELDPGWRGGDYYDAPDGEGPARGLGLARQIAHTTYRSAFELDERFGRLPQGAEEPLDGGRFAVQSYLDHHAGKLAARFDAGSYVALSRTMLTHDIGRDRGGVAEALAGVTSRTLAVAVSSDRLFDPADARRIADGVAGPSDYVEIDSPYGHDGFLVESAQVGAALSRFLSDRVDSFH
ncbi:homoserine O-acetyltransferase MetX [Georgenia sp. Z1491]|uniref:homoserine O-acetyltransferase MetX n=1 Tax=Georgenia sp. Z1491 TaxID=3416707 RepID=UPI003CEB727A